jgi:hypothetical protein
LFVFTIFGLCRATFSPKKEGRSRSSGLLQ